MEERVTSQVNDSAATGKKKYHAPVFTTIGTVEQITQAGASTGAEAFGNSAP